MEVGRPLDVEAADRTGEMRFGGDCMMLGER